MRAVTGKVVGRWRRGGMWTAFATWVGWSRRARELRRIMRRWQNMMASRALTRWRCAVAELKRLERISVKVMRQWRGLDLNLAWLTWLEHIRQANEERETKKGIEQEDLKQAADLLNEALRSANDELSMSRAEHGKLQRSSQQMVEAQGAYRERMMLRSAGRLLHRGMARAFGRWEECARAMRDMRRKAGAMRRRWKQRELVIIFQSWLGVLTVIKAQRHHDFSSPLPTTVFSSRKLQMAVTSFSSRKGSPGCSVNISDPDLVALNPVYSGNHDFIGIFLSVTPFFP